MHFLVHLLRWSEFTVDIKLVSTECREVTRSSFYLRQAGSSRTHWVCIPEFIGSKFGQDCRSRRLDGWQTVYEKFCPIAILSLLLLLSLISFEFLIQSIDLRHLLQFRLIPWSVYSENPFVSRPFWNRVLVTGPYSEA